MMSARKMVASTRSLLGKVELPRSKGSGRIFSKHGGHTARNRRRHGVRAYGFHHYLQIERFLANAQIIIEQSEADGADRRHEDASNKVSHLRENRPKNQQFRLLRVDRHEHHEWELKHGNDTPDHREVKHIDHERASGKISRQVKA